MPKWTTDDMPDQRGRTFVVTGANGGLGLRTAEALAARGARVLMACRNRTKAADALDQVKAAATDMPPEIVPLDLSDLTAIRARRPPTSNAGLTTSTSSSTTRA